ncbi:MAG: hypothetical protein PHU08_06185 [Dehalococcoidales bacterium]|nr:hypothetical protein [Dehalococcoidales bacterium]
MMQNKSQVGGILSIISGALGVIGFLAMMAMILMFRYMLTSPTLGIGPEGDVAFGVVALIYGILGFILLVLGAIGIIGGIFAVKRRLWGLALAGAICGILTFLPTGIVATIFVAQAQSEFSVPNPTDSRTTSTPAQP